MLNYTEPLYLPRGSVRAILALLITVATIISAALSGEIFKALLPLTALIIGYYFGKRNNN